MAAKNRKRKSDRMLAKAIELRGQGKTLVSIGVALDVSASTVAAWLCAALELAPSRAPEAAEQYLAVELGKLAGLEMAFLPVALEGDVRAAECVLQVMDRRAKYLGLYAPTKAEHDLRMGYTGEPFRTKEQLESDLRAAIAARRAKESSGECGGSPGRPR